MIPWKPVWSVSFEPRFLGKTKLTVSLGASNNATAPYHFTAERLAQKPGAELVRDFRVLVLAYG